MKIKIEPSVNIGMLTIISIASRSPNGHIKWLCKCDCGKETIVFSSNLKRQHTTSCGCANKKAITKHGLWGSSIYNSWHSMLQRCNNPNSIAFKHYGGRGISVYAPWIDFEKFNIDMGASYIDGFTIERINVNGNYEPKNCCWIPKSEQNKNKRNSLNKKAI